jgi:heptosyltransferase II
MEKILIIQTAFLGDLILSTGFFRGIKEKYPNSHITVLINKGTESILDGNPFLNEVIPIDKKKTFKNPYLFVKFLISLQKYTFTLCFSPHFSHRSSIISYFSGAKIRIGYVESGFSFLHTKRYHRPIKGPHEVQKLFFLLEDSNILKPEIHIKDDKVSEIDEIIKNLPSYIAIAPSSLWETKRMPISKFSELIQLILKNTNYLPVIIGSKNDKDLAQSLLDEFGSKILDLTGKTNLIELSYVISKSKCVISNDSSPIHIASAFNIPTLAIFGATIPDFGYTPLSDKAYISEIHLDCRPCGIHGGRICPKKHFKCMIEQDIGLIFDNILKLIK